MLDFNSAPRQLEQVNAQDWEARVEALRVALRARAHDLVKDIFPRARFQSDEARIGSLDGDAGESLSISLKGDSAGLWIDHATGEGGDLIDLWRHTRGSPDFRSAADDLEIWAGLTSKPAWSSPVAKVAQERKAIAAKEPKADTSLGPPVASYIYTSAAGALIGIVRRYNLQTVDETTGKPKKTFRPFDATGAAKMPDPRPLYRLAQINTASEVVLVEGEKCADALQTVGIEATTVMGGANADPKKTDWSPLAGKTVLVWEDNDSVGSGLCERVRPSLEAVGCTVSKISIPLNKPTKWDAADAVEEGEDIAAIIATARRVIPTVRFRIYTIDELANVAPPEWRIDGIFPTHGSSTIYGAFESFKTWVALDMLLCLAAGKPWQGRELKQCDVLYIAGEGQHGIAHRVLGWCAANLGGERPQGFRAIPEAVAIPLNGDTDDLLRAIDSLAMPPSVIALDTITRMSGGGSLNDEKDMQAYVRGMDRVRIHTGAHIMNIGHSGKDRDKGLLGSVVLPAAMETIICVEREKDHLTLINSNPKGKQKDGPNFDDIRLVTRSTEFERNGEMSSTLVLMADNDIVSADKEEKDPRKRALGALQQRIMDAVKAGSADGGMGFTRLRVMTGANDGSLARSLKNLEERGLIVATGDVGAQRWIMGE